MNEIEKLDVGSVIEKNGSVYVAVPVGTLGCGYASGSEYRWMSVNTGGKVDFWPSTSVKGGKIIRKVVKPFAVGETVHPGEVKELPPGTVLLTVGTQESRIVTTSGTLVSKCSNGDFDAGPGSYEIVWIPEVN